jgi:geranylgeranyl transferase type-2 subunit beta
MEWVFECQNEDGGFGGNVGHDSHITSTHYSLLISIVLERMDEFIAKSAAKLIDYTLSLFDSESGGFWGDSCKLEQDLRFTYCAVSTLTILKAIHRLPIDKIAKYVIDCYNYDGSFGGIPNMESHGAYVFCAVGSLKILDRLDLIDKEKLAMWLSERQTVKGGFNGRPEKLPDVCYSWWIYSSLLMIGM